jgi:hypothetical protein
MFYINPRTYNYSAVTKYTIFEIVNTTITHQFNDLNVEWYPIDCIDDSETKHPDHFYYHFEFHYRKETYFQIWKHNETLAKYDLLQFDAKLLEVANDFNVDFKTLYQIIKTMLEIDQCITRAVERYFIHSFID